MHPVVKLVTQRIALGLLLLLAVSALIFFGVAALPGDTAQAMLGQSATPEALANLREKLGLNEPIVWRYLHWRSGRVLGQRTGYCQIGWAKTGQHAVPCQLRGGHCCAPGDYAGADCGAL
jgi:ABC-type dipeptide/oligopeptide/nickel transport system permease component